MTKTEEKLWAYAETAVKNNEEELFFKTLQVQCLSCKMLALYSLYEKLIKSKQKLDIGLKDI